MRILIYGLNFSPELTGVGKYSGEFAVWLSSKGHDVRVVTTPPYFPGWAVHKGFSAWRYTRSESSSATPLGQLKLGSLRIFRCPILVPTAPSGFARLLHLLSFAMSSFPVMLFHVFWRPRVVIVVEPSISCVPGALITSWLCASRSWLHIQDFEVDAAFNLGLMHGKFLNRCALACEAWLMRRFDRVSTISLRMRERALAKGVTADRLSDFPNWIIANASTPSIPSNGFRKELGLSTNSIVALYSGSMGQKQGLELLARVAERLQNIKDLVFVFCGNGSGRGDLVTACKGLTNVQFLDLQPLERLSELLRTADIHLLPQRDGVADFAMPSKLGGMLASGRPIVATANHGTELADIVKNCGLVTATNNVTEFADAILQLNNDGELRRQYGAVGRDYALQNLDRDKVLSRVTSQLEALGAK